MANYRKSFNLRNGVQVDDDNFIVNSNGLVGIGTSIPTEFLDVRGNAKIDGLVTASSISTPNLTVSGIVTATTITNGKVIINSGIITAVTGIVTYYGDGSGLSNIPTSQWTTVSTIFGSASIYNTSGAIGILTTYPYHYVQIGENPLTGSGVGFNSTGGIIASGIITANSFSGSGIGITSLSASNIIGTLGNSLLPSNINVSGVVTASNFVGNLTGIASTANTISSSADIRVNSINTGFSTSGISTIHTKLHVLGNIGVGTLNPNAQIHLRKTGISSIQLTSDGSNSSTITIGRSVASTSSNAQIRFGNTNLSFLESTEQSLDIINYDTGNVNFYLNPGGSGTGSFSWFKPSLGKMMTLTSSGNLGINSSSPTSRLSVEGNVNISGVTTIGGNLTVNGSFSSSNVIFNSVGIATNNASYTLQIGSPASSSGVGISSTGNIVASGSISGDSVSIANTISANQVSVAGTASANNLSVGSIACIGIINAQNGFTSNNANPVIITVVGSTLTFTVNGVGSTSLTLY